MPNGERGSAEKSRLEESFQRTVDWKLWGPYVSERGWGTVREDYSADGSAWDYFPFEHALHRAYRWNEDGIAGISDRKQNICFALTLWNRRDPILKERFFGLGGNAGNHGEDVKEYYFYLDNTPTHSYMKFLYKYPQNAYPYQQLIKENERRGKTDPEYELMETGVFEHGRYFDVYVEYAKAGVEDICVKITAVNRSEKPAPLHLLPTLWFRNTWSWDTNEPRPDITKEVIEASDLSLLRLKHERTGEYFLIFEGGPRLFFTENETNFERLFGSPNRSRYTKDAANSFLVEGVRDAVNPEPTGTKVSVNYVFNVDPLSAVTVHLRLSRKDPRTQPFATHRRSFIENCEGVILLRAAEADEFYGTVIPANLSADEKNVMRQSLAGMLWAKQFYNYVVRDWLLGDPGHPPPPKTRLSGRNSHWTHLHNDDILSMPDKWEYPWYAAWDLAFHCIPLALVDPEFAKRQLMLLVREWYMHPNGQIPAYEWAFGDVNPPVHAWAALRVYQIEAKRRGAADRAFLEKIFHKLLLNFTWWVNRKDEEGNNIFEGGFLGLDNIGIFDRSKALPTGGHLEQSDGTSWMAMFCLNMLGIALELAKEDKVYEDVASKFFEHFVYISDAMNKVGPEDTRLWDEHDGFYYDVLHLPHERNIPLRIRSMVGLIPLFAVETLEDAWLADLPNFRKRADWFLKNRPDLTADIACLQEQGREGRRLLSVVSKERLKKILDYMLDEGEFLSEYGVRALSRYHLANPFFLMFQGTEYKVAYEPGESTTELFGGNSNWRGPVWFPMNYLLIESLQKFDYFYGDELKVEVPTGSGNLMNLWQVSQELERRLARLFLRDETGRRPVYGPDPVFQSDEHWRDHILFYEYFHGDSGVGLGASHQTGWTGLIGKILQQLGNYATAESSDDMQTTIQFRYFPTLTED